MSSAPPEKVQIRYVPAPPAPPPKPLRRLGCILITAIWFVILLIPLVFIVLAAQGEIRITTGDVPDQHIRLWLIGEPRQRGIGISSAGVHSRDDTNVCLQTSVNYLLWAGASEPSSYCECYQRGAPDEAWGYVGGNEGTCE